MCNGGDSGSIDLTVTGGTAPYYLLVEGVEGDYSYQWSNNTTVQNVSGLEAGAYSVIVTDENGCSESTTVDITEPEEINITETHSDYGGFGVSCVFNMFLMCVYEEIDIQMYIYIYMCI